MAHKQFYIHIKIIYKIFCELITAVTDLILHEFSHEFRGSGLQNLATPGPHTARLIESVTKITDSLTSKRIKDNLVESKRQS